MINKAQEYCNTHGLSLGRHLGHGVQGMVFASTRESALKVHALQAAYLREREVYRRLAENNVGELRGFIIPQLYNYDDSRLIIEMSIVAPPFIVDFGGAYLDSYPEHAVSKEKYSEWEL